MLTSFYQKCINDTLQGLREGLSHFSGPSTAAVIYRLPNDESLSIYDPDSLLRGHELKLQNFYFDINNRQIRHKYKGHSTTYSHIKNVPELQIDGLISYGGSSATVPYQMWFAQHHPDLSSTGPTERWLEHAVLRFSHDIANDEELYTGISGSFLREYSTHAIHDHITTEILHFSNAPVSLDVYPILNAILGISKTREEGAWPFGELVFVDSETIETVHFLARFLPSELPQLNHHKHVRKLLQTVENSHHKLISDGSNILGISNSNLPPISLTADFCGRYGFLRISGDDICSFSDGRYKSSTHLAKLYEVEEALLDYNLDAETRNNLFQIISTLVHNAQKMKHGCTFVLDLNDQPAIISGQILQKPLNLNDPNVLDLACSFSKVDGALHIYLNQHLLGFACLLDGHTIAGEDRARGARYNSALRFTAEKPNTLVIVVSADRPVSVVQHGIEFQGQCQWLSGINCALSPEPLHDWLITSG
jgi:hypothetical protein